MTHQSLYLKYRPSQLDEMVGQENFVNTLRQASVYDRYARAYMFCWVKGTGKTTSSRIVANLMNCDNVQNGVVCGQCRACKTIPYGQAMDVIELDGAQQRKAEDVAALIEAATWSPQECKRKVYILDEVHQLSTTAISSLLKIVEEPPPNLYFIFCTTEPDKIPDTILSRSQKHVFGKIHSSKVAERLKFIAESEGYAFEESAFLDLAKMGRGSMRDAIGFLEQIATATNNNITQESLNKYFQLVDRRGIYALIESMVSGDHVACFERSSDMVQGYVDVRWLLHELSEAIRNIQKVKILGESHRLLDLPDYEIKKLSSFASQVGLGQLNKLSSEFSTIEKELTYSVNKELVVESLLIRCTARLSNSKKQ